MSEAFRGEFNQKVDGKARVSIPAPFRRILEAEDPGYSETSRPRFVIVYGDERRNFLECYTITEMNALERQIAAMPRGTAARRILERNLITLSVTAEVDDDGRIVLPAKARAKIGITAEDLKSGVEAVFAGALDTFQIWRADTFEAEYLSQAEAEFAALGEDADILSLLPARAEG